MLFIIKCSTMLHLHRVKVMKKMKNHICQWLLLAVSLLLASYSYAGEITVTTQPTVNFQIGCNGYITVGDIVFEESTDDDDFPINSNHTYYILCPDGFEFLAGVGSSVAAGNPNDIDAISIEVKTDTIIVTIETDGIASKQDKLTLSGIQVKLTTAGIGTYYADYDATASSGSWDITDGLNHATFVVAAASGTISSAEGPTTGDWTTGASWSGASAPGSCNDVVIKSGDNITVDDDVSCNDLTIESGGTLTMGKKYTCNGTHSGGTMGSDFILNGADTIDGTGTSTPGGGVDGQHKLCHCLHS